MPMIRTLAWALLCLSGLTATGHAVAEKLVVFGDEAYAPVIYLDQGRPMGILPAIFARLAKDTGDTYELALVPWKRALNESLMGHGAITNISFNKEREALYDFSEPIYNDDLQLVVLKGKEFVFNGLQDLKGKSVGGAHGASYGDDVDRAIADGLFTMERDPNQLSRLKKLLLKRMDVAIIGNGTVGFEQLLVSDPVLQANRSNFVVLQHPLTRDPLYLAFLKTMRMKPALDRFNKALAKLKKTPEYGKLVNDIP
jgi:polar amino acid transport system substrate-binding protein